MKHNLFKRSAIFLMIALMLLTSTCTVFAAETTAVALSETENVTVAEYSVNVGTTGEVMVEAINDEVSTFANSPVRGVVPSNSYIDLYPQLESYIGFNKTFIVNATSDSTSGALFLYLYKPNGDLASHDWIMGVNEIAQWSLFLPSSGEWRLRVVAQGTTASVNVYARWE